MRKRTTYIAVLMVLVFSTLTLFKARAQADEATIKLYQSKCVSCHAADGSGSTAVGKALKLKDIRSPEVQAMSDAELTAIISKGKDKMPAYEKTMKPEQIKSMVAYMRELAKK
jgi:mono/diheme cytochrome c family protein